VITGASLALLVVLGQVPAADPSELVNRLGAARFADREAAAAGLERLGRRALPALRTARDQRDPEIRSRAAALVTRIEGALLTQPSQITLDFNDAPLTDVIRTFGDQAGIKLILFPETSQNLRDRRVTLRESAPLPFWKAIDRLCEAGRLQYNLGMHALPGTREQSIALSDGVRPPVPASDTGPFRVSLVAINYQRNLNFAASPFSRIPPAQGAGARLSPLVHEQFYAQIQIAVEPRLSVSQTGALNITEAQDDKGNPLVEPSAAGPDVRRSGYFGVPAGSVLQLQVPLIRPAQPGTSIKRLKGLLPVTVTTRKPNPLNVPLGRATGRTFKNDEVSVVVHEFRTSPNNRPSILEITVRPSSTGQPVGLANDGSIVARADSHLLQLEVTDNHGRPLPWHQTNFDVEAGRMTMSLTSPDPGASAAELHYYSLSRATTEVGFEFVDLPMP
jgi:hypothetical protein